MNLDIPIYDRSRKYGYIFWRKHQDDDVRSLLGKLISVVVVFNGEDLGKKNIDWNYRRISIGGSLTRKIYNELNIFQLSLSSKNVIEVICK